ncbi:uncharacterized protein KY384_005781 [Bacidia gigantensis]|uniref:uncharacterized protein n=1 Tax=Bacidia gigantensis TaxID=2732470 RepID=UPI001D03E96E|nr:uncharacterized protein KY384_005781 [Bacidia gigantensis]KAG8529146.1 hypothetical protein KY384_005781 [Bacidia gigantensis]
MEKLPPELKLQVLESLLEIELVFDMTDPAKLVLPRPSRCKTSWHDLKWERCLDWKLHAFARGERHHEWNNAVFNLRSLLSLALTNHHHYSFTMPFLNKLLDNILKQFPKEPWQRWLKTPQTSEDFGPDFVSHIWNILRLGDEFRIWALRKAAPENSYPLILERDYNHVKNFDETCSRFEFVEFKDTHEFQGWIWSTFCRL